MRETTVTTTVQAQPRTIAPPASRRGQRPLAAHLVPHAAVGALVIAAGAARLAVNLTGSEASVATWTAATAFVVAVVVATRARRRIWDKRTLRRMYVFCAVATTWLTTVTATGLSVGAVGVLMALGYGLSLHWWRTHPIAVPGDRRPVPTPAEPAQDDVDPAPPTEPYADLWAANVACSGGALPGSELTDMQPIKAGVRYTLLLRPGMQTLEMAQAAFRRLRGGLWLRRNQQLIIEPHPDLPEPHLLLTIVTRSPVAAGVDWPGPDVAFDPDTGRVRLGPYADGEGIATWRAYTSHRLWGGFIQGGTGSGKSRLIESLALSLASSRSHPTVVWYADGQGGASSPMLMRHADLFAGTYDRILAMVTAMHLVMLLRQRENVEMEAEGFAPAPDRPGLLGIIDECHKALHKAENPDHWEATQRLCATISREGGKVGVALVLASQEPTLNAFGGAGSPYCEALRSSLLTGNGIMLAGDDPNAKTIFGVSANPKTFPTGGGYGYVAKPADGEREAMFRSYYLTDVARRTWPDQITWRSLDGLPAGQAIPNYATRERTYADRKRVVNGIPLDTTTPTPAPTAAATTTSTSTGDLGLFGARAFPTWAEIAARFRAGGGAVQQLGDGHHRVLAAIKAGHRSPQRIADATAYSVRQVHNLLGDLVATGRVRKDPRKQGVYHLATAAA